MCILIFFFINRLNSSDFCCRRSVFIVDTLFYSVCDRCAKMVQNQQKIAVYHHIARCVVVLRHGRPEVRILPVAPRAAPYGVLLFLFCMDFMEQQKGGFEQPVPRALRPAGQKRPGGALLGHGLANPFGRTKNHLAMYFTQ